MTCTEAKPAEAPYFYRVRGITPSPGNEWRCVNGVWEWRMTDHEKGQEPDASKKFESQFIACKTPVGYYKIEGEYLQVCKSTWGGYYYIKNYRKYNLSASWVYENITKPGAKEKAKSILPEKDPFVGLMQDPESGKWAGMDVGSNISRTIRAPFDKSAQWMQGIAGGGGLVRSLQTTAIVLMLFVLAIFYLIFVRGKGAEGVSVSAVGK